MPIGAQPLQNSAPDSNPQVKVLHPDWWADKPNVAAFVEARFRELQDEVAKICA